MSGCYNAIPLPMRPALDDLATQAPSERRRAAVPGPEAEAPAHG